MALTIAEEVKRLTSDPGARKLGEYMDSVMARLDKLEKQVADCCGAAPVAGGTGPTRPG